MEDKLHWIDLGDGEYKCPKCSREFINGLDIQTFSKYFPSCPNCGTKMSKGKLINRRSEKLDHYIDKWVKITFTDGDSRIGILGWNEHLEPLMIIPQQYYLRNSDGIYFSFRKSHVKSIKEARE